MNRSERRRVARNIFRFPVNLDAVRRIEKAKREGLLADAVKNATPRGTPVGMTVLERNGQVVIEFDKPVSVFAFNTPKAEEFIAAFQRALDASKSRLAPKATKNEKVSENETENETDA